MTRLWQCIYCNRSYDILYKKSHVQSLKHIINKKLLAPPVIISINENLNTIEKLFIKPAFIKT